MWLTRLFRVDAARTTPPHSFTSQLALNATKVFLVQRHESHAIASPAGSITKLGIVRFVLSEEPHVNERHQPRGIVELPSFSGEESLRPTVQMPPLTERRERPVSRPGSEGLTARNRGQGGHNSHSGQGSPSGQNNMTAWMLR
jgi:hypothetical protein